MKKLVLLVAAVALTLNGVAQTAKKRPVRTKTPAKTAVVAKPGYTVSGTIEGATDGDKVYLAQMNYMSFIPLDSTKVKNGQFEFKGSQKSPDLRFIVAMKGKEMGATTDFILENTNIKLNVMKDGKKTTIDGGRDNVLWREYNKKNDEISEKGRPYWDAARDTTKAADVREKANAELEKIQGEQMSFTAKFIRENLPSGLSEMLLGYYYSNFDETTLDGILSDMKVKCPTSYVYKELTKQQEIAKKTGIGKQYTDIALNNPDGKLIKVSDFVAKNKLTMIDFWASWCGPCRAEMPNFIKIYNEYKDKGFGVVGVSLDSKADAWKGAIKKLGIPWAQMSDLKGWSCKGAELYNVKSIPATVLINQKGEIVAKDLRGADLEAKLKELLK